MADLSMNDDDSDDSTIGSIESFKENALYHLKLVHQRHRPPHKHKNTLFHVKSDCENNGLKIRYVCVDSMCSTHLK